MLDKKLIENEYGYMKDHIYLNLSLVGMPPERVKNTCRKFMDDYASTFAENIKSNFAAMREGTKDKIAQLINANPEEIIFVKNTTEGNSIFAMGYSIQPGSNVIVNDSDYPNTLFPWINAQRRGFQLKVIATKKGQVPAEDVIAAMDDHTRVVALSAVHSFSGYFADLKAIGSECRKRGIAFAVDGIQGLGRLNIDVQDSCIDYLTSGGYKGLMGTFGAGFVYCNPNLIRDIIPPYAGYQSTCCYTLFPQVNTDFSGVYWYEDTRRLEAGHHNTYGITAMGEGIELILELGILEIQEHVKTLEAFLREKLAGLPLEVIEPEDSARQSGIIAILFPDHLLDKARVIMEKYKIHLTMRKGYMRLTIGVYNTLQHMETVFKALCELSEHIQSK